MVVKEKSFTYRQAGVDIEAGEKVVKLIRDYLLATRPPEVISGVGGFAGLFSFKANSYKEPVLVSATDGVGTKLLLAQELGKHQNVGVDLVAMVLNDLVTVGAQPLFFLDYIACDKVVPEVVVEIVKGIAEGCRQVGCALIGGETAEMPDFYPKGRYDLAGFGVGVVERTKIVDGSKVEKGDIVLGLASSGLHSNGFSLARKIIKHHGISLGEKIKGEKRKLREVLLEPTRLYVSSVLKLLAQVEVHGLAHITGGGLSLNIPRVLPKGLSCRINLRSWPKPPIFQWVQEMGQVDEAEMLKTFNLGLGFVIILPSKEKKKAIKVLEEAGEQVFVVGQVERGSQEVVYEK